MIVTLDMITMFLNLLSVINRKITEVKIPIDSFTDTVTNIYQWEWIWIKSVEIWNACAVMINVVFN